MNQTIRICTRQDIEILADTIRRSFRDIAERFGLNGDNCPRHASNCTQEWIEKEMDRGSTYFKLEKDSAVAGCVALKRTGPEVFSLERLAVLPPHRHQGSGRALVLHALAEASSLGASRVELGIIADHTELKEWYERLGFVESGTRDFPHLPFRVMFMSCEMERGR